MAEGARPERQNDVLNVSSAGIYRWHPQPPGEVSQILEFSGYVPVPTSELEDVTPSNSRSQRIPDRHVEPLPEGNQTAEGDQKRRRRTRRRDAAVTSAAMELARSPEEMHEPWLTRQEAAKYLGNIHPNTLDELRRKGKIKPIYITPRTLRYPVSELERFAREQQGLSPLGPVVMPPPPEPTSKRPRARPWNVKD